MNKSAQISLHTPASTYQKKTACDHLAHKDAVKPVPVNSEFREVFIRVSQGKNIIGI